MITHWKTSKELIKISDMTDVHLNRTINMLYRQIDGSAHDDWVYDNISAMKKELMSRQNNTDNIIKYKPGDSVWVYKIEDYRECIGRHEERAGYDHLGPIGVMVDDYRYVHKEGAVNVKFYYGLLDEYSIDRIYETESECLRKEKYEKMDKITGVEFKVAGVTFKNDDGSDRGQKIIEISKNRDNTIIEIEREPSNRFDPNAVMVKADGVQIGYIPKDYASILSPLMDQGRVFNAKIKDCGEYKNRPYAAIIVDER